ncbi:TRAP transporter large permease [Chloroflexota bacterium]
MDPTLISVLLLVGLLVMLIIGLPIYVCLGLISVIGILMLQGPSGLGAIPAIILDKTAAFVLIAMPLFILMGETIFITGMGGSLYTMFGRWFNRLPGALAMASTAASAVFGAMCGVSSAGTATIGVIAVPEMLERDYDKSLATGSVAAAGALSVLIPPSVPFILYGSITGTSVGRLFIAGIVPGIILSLMMMLYIGILVWLRPQLAPPMKEVVTWKSRFSALGHVWPSVLLIVLVLGAIYTGIATPTEAAAVGAVGALLLALLVYRALSWRVFVNILRQTVVTNGMIMWIVACAMLFGYVLTALQAPQNLALFVSELQLPLWGIYGSVIFILLLAGMVVDLASMVLLTTPILLPIVLAVGADPIWYGVILVLAGEMALITPPVGVNCYIIHGISAPLGVNLPQILRGAMPFVAVELACIAIFMAFPELALWLPTKMMG